MGATRPNPRLAKIHRNYTVEEVARLYGVHRNTVRAWIKAGLRTIDDRRPLLIHGTDLAQFLRERQARNRCKCGPGEMFCFRCRQPRRPAGGIVDYKSKSARLGALSGRCPECNARMFRRVSTANLARDLGTLVIAMGAQPAPAA